MTTPPSTSDSRRSVAPLLSFARAWKDGGCPTVEEFLARHHPAGVGVDDLLDLVQQEIVSREARGEVPRVEDFRRRFAAHADHIGALFEVNALFAAGLPPTADGDDPAGPDLADYEVEDRLAAGGMGEIYAARDAALGRRVAVKVLRAEWQDDPQAVARFWGEARTTARLQHPGVVPVYEAGVDANDRPFIAMKLVEGRTLAALFADRPADPADLIGVFEHVCQTLAYAHTQGVIHRDLKPANVMVGGFGEVQVMDWGLARGLSEPTRAGGAPAGPAAPVKVDSTVPHGGLTVDGEMIGTPGYMPPEQARGDHDRVGPASDVFGLGAILCELLTGHPPFDGSARARAGDLGPARARLAAVTGEAELVRLAVACLAPDPAARPPDAGAVCVALAAYRTGLRDRVRAAELAAARAPAERKARRRTEVIRLLAVLFALGAGFGGWGWFHHQADLGRDVEAALDEARAARAESVKAGGDPAHTAHAEKAAHRAEGLMRGLAGRADLRDRCADLLADLERDAADPAMVRRLDEIRVQWDPSDREPKSPAPADRYGAAFRDYGIDVTALEPEEAARRVTARAARADLIAALDYWGLECLRSAAPDPSGRRALAVARAADPDPWRVKLRDAVAGRDLPALRAMAKEAESADLPVPVLVVLGAAVADRATDRKQGWVVVYPSDPAGVALLRVARQRAPGDFWANYHLAVALTHVAVPRLDEAVRYFTAAVAVRPDLPGVRGLLASTLRLAGDFPAALAVARDEIRARPGEAAAHSAYAHGLKEQGEYTAALAEYAEARRLDPTHHLLAFNIAGARLGVGAAAEALAEARAESAADPADRTARRRLVHALTATGRLTEAMAEVRRQNAETGDTLWTALEVKRVERDADIAGRVATADPTAVPIAADDLWAYVKVCSLTGRDWAAVRLAERARAVGTWDAATPDARFDAVGAAVRAGTGANPTPDPAEPARCRGLALDWLRGEFARRAADAQKPNYRMSVRRTLRTWEQHRALAAVRDPEAIARLPAAEHAGWRTFWDDVAKLVGVIDRR